MVLEDELVLDPENVVDELHVYELTVVEDEFAGTEHRDAPLLEDAELELACEALGAP